MVSELQEHVGLKVELEINRKTAYTPSLLPRMSPKRKAIP